MMSSNQSPNRSKLMQEINETSFAVNDIQLYLDTHPCDENALEFFRKNASRRNELLGLYAREFGPLTIDSAVEACGDTFQWAQQPFPWEEKGGCR